MRRLILFRHGKAEEAGVDVEDRDRALADRGRADSAQTAAWLLARGYVPDVVLVSPAVRTRATWDSVQPCFADARVEVRSPLYLAGPDTILEMLESAPEGADTVMVVGHNPGLQELGADLAESGDAPEAQINRLGDGFPTAAAAVFRVEDAAAATLEALYEPARAGDPRPRWSYSLSAAGEKA